MQAARYNLEVVARIAALVALVVGCHRVSAVDQYQLDDTDPGSDTDADSDSDADTDADTDDGDDWVGIPCDPPVDEGEEDPCPGSTGDNDSFCFAWSGAPGGFCTKECSAATYEVPVQDGCPTFEGVVCMDISGHTGDPADDEDGYDICVEECVPEPLGQPGPCKAPYQSCNPWAWAWESQFATCLLSKCQTDEDCLVPSGPECTDDDDCAAAEGDYCTGDGTCVFDGDCDPESGRCTWEAGDPDAEPGDPCETSHDCNSNAICIPPQEDSDDKVAPANGYCLRYGCKAADAAAPNGSGSTDSSIQDEFNCGMMGSCHNGFDHGGACLKRCNPPNDQDAFRCRQQSWGSEVLDANGDYDCYHFDIQYPIWTTGNIVLFPAAVTPGCAWISRDVPLRVGGSSKCGTDEDDLDAWQCNDFYGGGFILGMTCRDAETGELDEDGYCLDSTASGPTEDWESDTDTGTG
jgi:hypothetical protein